MFNFNHKNIKSVKFEKQLLCTTSTTFSLINKNKRKILSTTKKKVFSGIYL